MSKVIQVCKYCGKEFLVETKELNRGYGLFCSKLCFYNYRKSIPKLAPKHNCQCAYCNKSFYRTRSGQKNSRSGLQFCSRQCKDLAQRIGGIQAIQPNHYGNGEYSYRQLALDHLPHKCANCNYDKHIQVLVVHHIDGDRTNNNLSNLKILCRNCHYEVHLLDENLNKTC